MQAQREKEVEADRGVQQTRAELESMQMTLGGNAVSEERAVDRARPGTDGQDGFTEGARVAPGGGPGAFRRGERGGADVSAVGVAFVTGRASWV